MIRSKEMQMTTALPFANAKNRAHLLGKNFGVRKVRKQKTKNERPKIRKKAKNSKQKFKKISKKFETTFQVDNKTAYRRVTATFHLGLQIAKLLICIGVKRKLLKSFICKPQQLSIATAKSSS